MQTITTTELRTKSKKLIESLKKGESVDLIHRSKIVAEIKPKIDEPEPFDPVEFEKLLDGFILEEISDEEAEKRYRDHLKEKYGGK